jgi:hypothetical protein
VAFDESETEENAKERLLQILSLMRQASSEGNGAIYKGSANHVAHEFNIRSAFMLVSIGVNIKQGADLSRIAVLTLRPQTSFACFRKESVRRKMEPDAGYQCHAAARLAAEADSRGRHTICLPCATTFWSSSKRSAT